MNKEVLDSLPIEQKRAIEAAYLAVINKESTPAQFFAHCREILGSHKFSLLFSKPEPQPSIKQPVVDRSPTKDIKTEYLQDIIQYSGVDLKEEAEYIVKESEHNIRHSYYKEEDKRNSIESLLKKDLFVEYVNKIVSQRGICVSEDVYQVIFMILKRKLTDMIAKMKEVCELRVDLSRTEYIIKIENDVKRQLWCLEQNEKKEMEKLKIKKTDAEDEGKKKIKKVVQEREDILIKKRLSNNVALAALGGHQKSWMAVGDVVTPKEEEEHFESLYSPFNEKDIEKKIHNRSITMADFIYVLERDKRYNKSIFTIQQYFN